MAFSMQDAITQNTVGYSEGRPVGVPTSYSWYSGVYQASSAPPSNFTAVTGWGSVYQQAGEPAYSNPNAKVEVANAKTYVHLRSTGEWVLVQNQSDNSIVGGHFVADLAGNAGTTMNVTKNADGSVSFAAPPSGYNDHFWPSARGTYQAGDVDAVYVQMDMRATDPNLNLVANVGADWWRDANAGFSQDFSNNPGAGISNWVELSTEWKTIGYYSSKSIFESDPPPTFTGETPGTDTPPITTPTDPSGGDGGETTPPTTGANLLVNGSFEATSVAEGSWKGSSSIPGWTAVSGGTIELWNNTNGVKASNGSNFGELDYLGAKDGLSQTVKTTAGQSYDLSFDARSRPGFTASTTTIEVLWNDTLVATVPPGSNWNSYNFTVTGTGGQDRLTFREADGQGGDGLGALYDNVSLVAASGGGTTVPPDGGTTAPTTPPPTGSNLLVNGSFESSNVASGQWEDFKSVAGWTAVSGGTIELWNNLNGVKASNGENFGELDYLGASDGLYQTVDTEAGQRYTLSFDARSRPGTDVATNTIEVVWNDTVVARVPPGSDWTNHKFTVTGTGGQDRLTFREAQGQSGDGLGALYDNVSLVAANSSSSTSTAAVSQMDQSMDLLTQYSAAASDTSSTASGATFYQAAQQDSLAPTLTQTHQLA